MSTPRYAIAAALAIAAGSTTFLACNTEAPAPAKPAEAAPKAEAPAAAKPAAAPAGEAPTLMLAEAQFVRGEDMKPKPGPALLTFWRKEGASWTSSTS